MNYKLSYVEGILEQFIFFNFTAHKSGHYFSKSTF